MPGRHRLCESRYLLSPSTVLLDGEGVSCPSFRQRQEWSWLLLHLSDTILYCNDLLRDRMEALSCLV